MTAVPARTVVFLFVAWLQGTAVPMHIFCTCHLEPRNGIIVQRTILFSTVPTPTTSTPHVFMKSYMIKATRKNIGASGILQAPSGTPRALLTFHLPFYTLGTLSVRYAFSTLIRNPYSWRRPYPPCPCQRPPFHTSSPSSQRSCPCSPVRYAP